MSRDFIFIRQTEPRAGFYKGVDLLYVHDPEKCKGEFCCIHNPSDHHMKDWNQTWRNDCSLMERICPHGVGHPDPDHIAYMEKVNPEKFKNDEIHGCDGCCVRPN